MHVRIAGQWREVAKRFVRIASTWRRISRRYYYNGTQWVLLDTFVPPLSLAITPSAVTGFRFNAGTAVTSAARATPTGGTGPYSYQWVRVGAGTSTATNPVSASTFFSREMTASESVQETWRCTVTDTFGTTATATVTATFTSAVFTGGNL